MFDQLIETNSREQGRKRSRYFVVSSVIVGALFLTAVVLSLYAEELDLGNEQFELSALLAPVPMPESQPEPPKPKAPSQDTQETNELPTRQSVMLRPDETPRTIPTTTSVVPNTQQSRPVGDFIIGPADTNPTRPPGTGRGDGTGNNPEGTGLSSEIASNEPTKIPEPPPVQPVKKPPTPSLGVVNGIAKSLPKPPYPAPAIIVNVQGNVDVQVTIDETGNVISSRAVSGHPLLRGAAEKAAWNAKFTPTYLSKVPVKVTGVIVYKFSRN